MSRGDRRKNSAIGGRHVFGNLYDVDEAIACDEGRLRKAVLEAADLVGMRVAEIKSWTFGGKKGGVSVIAILVGSHIAVHTWIEYRYATVDVYISEAQKDPWRAFEHLVKVLKPRYYTVSYADRSSLTLIKTPRRPAL
ncbi:MAG: adenosylmethionine decarboxylase [Thermoprotei archaeon]|nr:MAG: adenosylmethionine decarboxylase [Thermoprotei archaeon]